MAILLQLLDGDCNISELSESLSLPATVVSSHLNRLRVDGLIDFTRYHRIIEYRLVSEEAAAILHTVRDLENKTRGIVLESFPFSVPVSGGIFRNLMKITTWNVNSLNVRLPQVQNLLADNPPDILVLQELKLDQDKFPAAALQMMGWHCVWSGQKTYNGVAIISRSVPQDVHLGLPSLPDDPQRRVIAATVGGVRVINVYCVNGEALDSPKFKYKEQWFAALTEFVRDEMTRHGKLVLLGDFNIAPADADCYDPEKWYEKIHCSSVERQWFQNLLDLGLTDSLRHIHPEGAFYTWFDYRGAMFQRKLGLRIDHILVTSEMAAVLKDVRVDLDTRALERPSDHAPVAAEFDL